MVFTTDKNEPYRGETIKFIVPKSWSGKNVILMPYLNQSTEKVSTNLSVEASIKDTQKCDCICEERVRAFMRMLRVGEGKYNIDKAVAKLIFNKKTNSQGLCAKYVRIAIEAGGLSTEKKQTLLRTKL